jgi:predicted Zn finger-like uncharacterized protein
MKFLCPNCKAKYQIADEKVGGRTLKMDCRACGHTIVIRGGPQTQDVELPAAPPSPAASPQPATVRPHGAQTGSSPAVPAPGRRLAPAPGRRLAPAPAGPPRDGSHVGPTPARDASPRSALSADFRRQMSTGSHVAVEPPRTTSLDQWHVAIGNVPVGPMRRDEIARKIAAGAVTADSLAWREGLDDWRPLRDIPELAALLQGGEAMGGSDRRVPTGRAPAAGTHPPAVGSASRSAVSRVPAPHPPPAAPAARANVVPIGGRLGASAAPVLEDELDALESEPTRVATPFDLAAMETADRATARKEARPAAPEKARQEHAPAAPAAKETAATAAGAPSAPASDSPQVSMLPDPFPAAPPTAVAPASAPTSTASSSAASPTADAPPRTRDLERRGALPVGAWIGIAGAMSFGVAMAVMIAPRLLGPEPTAPAPATTTETAAAPPAASAAREAPVPTEAASRTEPSPEADAPSAPDEPRPPPSTTASASGGASPQSRGSSSTRRGGGGSSGSDEGAATQAAANDAVFSRFRDDGPTVESPLQPRPQTTTTESHRGGAASGEGLTSEQIRTVVTREQRTLQSCWELAIRGLRDVPTVRMDVDVTIGASGTVTSAHARGMGIGNLAECLERNVRRWRFPPSGDSSQASFPVVFSGTQ